MIKVFCFSGFAVSWNTFNGKVCTGGKEIKIFDVFNALLQKGYRWKVDYSGATEEEILLWFKEDLAARIVRALKGGLPVYFLDRKWQVTEDKSLIAIVTDLEREITSSGRMVSIDSDDENGLVIGTSTISP